MVAQAQRSRPGGIRDEDYRALAEFRLALRRYVDVAEAAANAAGMPPRQYQALLAIKGSTEPPTVGWVAEQLLIAPHTGLELVRRLEAAGYVRIVSDPADRRRRLLLLTADANRVLARLSAVHLAELRQRGPQLAQLLTRLSSVRARRTSAGD